MYVHLLFRGKRMANEDMVGSTRTTANIGDNYQKVAKYYSIFLNTMALIVKKFEGTISAA